MYNFSKLNVKLGICSSIGKINPDKMKSYIHPKWIYVPAYKTIRVDFVEEIEKYLLEYRNISIGEHYIPLSIAFPAERITTETINEFYTKILVTPGILPTGYGFRNLNKHRMLELPASIKYEKAILLHNKYM